jgi:hypothetical protein
MDIAVPSFREVRSDDGSFKVYAMHIRYADWEHIVEKRYSEFLELHEVIKLINKPLGMKLPAFPKKKYWTKIVGKSQEQLEERRLGLEVYMKELAQTQCARQCKYFIEFLGLPVRLRAQWVMG